MKDKKGQIGIAEILTVFIAILVGVILFQTVAQQVGTTTNTVALANHSLDTVVNGTAQYLTDYQAISGVVVYNETGDVIVGSGNYTITNNVVYNGALAVMIMPDASDGWKSAWQVSGTAQPLTYIADSGARSVTGLIVIFFALLVAAIALSPVFSSRVLESLGK